MSIIIPANSAVSGGFEASNSLMFNRADSAYLVHTNSGTGSYQKSTFSAWVKRSSLGTVQTMWNNQVQAGVNQVRFEFDAADKIYLYGEEAGGYALRALTTSVYRDLSAWYHVLVIIDTPQSAAADRIKLYVNGVQVTLTFTTTPAQDANLRMNYNSTPVSVGSTQASSYFNGYMAEVYWIDGTVYATSDFGEFDEDSGIWKPIDASGLTFGTNGFYLDFEDSSALGNDAAGSNNFTATNLAARDQATDTCTNNFCTLNPLAISNEIPTYSQGNCESVSSAYWHSVMGTMGFSSGKWYWEVKITTTGGNFHGVIADYVNFADATVYNEVGQTTYTSDDGGEMSFGPDTTTADYGVIGQNDITGIAVNMDDKQISIYDNGSAIVSNFALDDAANLGFVLPLGVEYSATAQWNFGGCSAFALSSAVSDANGYGNFEYAPPTGYYALCTKNLAEYG